MTQILEYATPLQPLITRKMIAALILAAGTVIYAGLCGPAMRQRGYPPLDHFWSGMTYWWVFPVPLFTLICPRGKFSRRTLALYALIGAYIDGCTVVMIVPHRFDLSEGFPMLLFFGPIHLIGVAVIALISRFIFRALDIESELESSAKKDGRTTGRIVTVLTILAAAGVFPFVFQLSAKAIDLHEGEARADALWADHTAYFLSVNSWMVPHQAGIYDIYSYFDSDSGLPLRHEMGMEYEQGYKARIQSLLSIHGVPAWSHKKQLVSDADLLGIFDAKDLKTVKAYPYDISPNVVLMHGGTVNRWGGYFSSGSNSLEIDTRCGGNLGNSNYFGNAAICRLAKYPGVIFVRGGNEWVAAVSDDGWILNAAMKSP
jgi:hypothetical protein